ncbi:MAG: hypothetical protein QXO80_02265 [Thermosphaera sp.]
MFIVDDNPFIMAWACSLSFPEYPVNREIIPAAYIIDTKLGKPLIDSNDRRGQAIREPIPHPRPEATPTFEYFLPTFARSSIT